MGVLTMRNGTEHRKPVLTCANVRPHLRAFWTEPQTLNADTHLRIQLHLRICADCQRAFSEITETHAPPWKQRPTA